jgi:xanthine dehydrogenase YagR molybdenum-binding subunit
MYECQNKLTQEYDVFTNAGPGAAFRAPGHPQGCFALEQAVDELAERLDMDPLDLRDRIDVNPQRRVERKLGREKFGWSERRRPNSDPGPVKRGMGAAQAVWYRIVNLDSAAEVRLSKDGSIELMSAVQDIGGGIKTVLAQVVAEEFGLNPEDVMIRIGDTRYPVGPPSGGSMTTASITPAARNAAYRLKREFFAAVAPSFGSSADDLYFSDGKLKSKSNPSLSLSLRQAAAKMKQEELSVRANRIPDYSGRVPRSGMTTLGGVHFAEVSVDTEAGRIHVERVLAVQDCGRPMNPLALQSQINGGVLQGISYALYESRVLNHAKGLMVNANFEQYKIIGSVETPKIEVLVIEDYQGQSSTDAYGIGEPATMATSAAIANAFYNATGVRMRRLPMTPSNIFAALGNSRSALS